MSRNGLVAAALEALERSGVKTRSACIEDLVRSLRDAHASPHGDVIPEATALRILKLLFDFVDVDRRAYEAAKTTTTKKATANKLSESSHAVRTVVELLHRQLAAKSVKAFLAHFLDNIERDVGGVCEPLALDYAKALSSLLEYQPHVEHLSAETWTRLAAVLLKHVDLENVDKADELDEHVTNGPSVTATFRTSIYEPTSQIKTGTKRQLVDEFFKALSYLTRAPTAPLAGSANDILTSIITYLRSSQILPAVACDAVGTINNVLDIVITESMATVRQHLSALMNIVQTYWQPKAAALNQELLSTLIYLMPYLRDFSSKGSICEVIRSEYLRRANRDRLALDDLDLRHSSQQTPLQLHCFSLTARRSAASYNWGLMTVLAALEDPLSVTRVQETQPEELDNGEARKRPRMTTGTASVDVGSSIERVLNLQILAFAAQSSSPDEDAYRSYLSSLIAACSEDDIDIATWAFIALSSFATHESASQLAYKDYWLSAWQVAARAITSTTTSRSSSHLLAVMLQLQLVPQSTASQWMQSLAASIDLNGPALLSDASLALAAIAVRRSMREASSLHQEVATQTINWLFRHWAIPTAAGRSTDAIEQTYDACDLFRLISACVGDSIVDRQRCSQPVASLTALTMVKMGDRAPLLNYILLSPSQKVKWHPLLQDDINQSQGSNQIPAVSQLMVANLTQDMAKLQHLQSDGHLAIESSSINTIKRLSAICLVAARVAHDLGLAELQVAGLKKQCKTLLTSILYHGGASESSGKLDGFLSVACLWYQARDPSASKSLSFLAESLSASFNKREELISSGAITDTPIFASQSQVDVAYETSSSQYATTVLSSESSFRAQANAVALQAQMRLAEPDQAHAVIAPQISDYITSLSHTDSLLAIKTLCGELGDLQLSDGDLEQILSLFSEVFLKRYSSNRSEVTFATIVDFMRLTVRDWTQSSNGELSSLASDIHQWILGLSAANGVLSVTTQQHVAALLVEMCKFMPDFGSEAGHRSARTALLQMLSDGSVRLQHFLAPKIPSMFSLFTITHHKQLFDDIQDSLPKNAERLESLMMRLQMLMQIGSSWPSLLQVCVYYIFETAGRFEPIVPHAGKSMLQLASALHIKDTTTLFSLFGPLILRSWLHNKRSLFQLPFSIFGYQSQHTFFQSNLAEITTQLFLRENIDDLDTVCATLRVYKHTALELAFDRAYSVAITQDTAIPSQASSDRISEQRLRSLLGDKELFRRLLKDRYPVILGRIMLAVNVDSDDEKFLESHDGFQHCLKAYKHMREWGRANLVSSTTSSLGFRSKYIFNQFGRLAKRLGLPTIADLWSPASFAMASQMLLDSLDSRLSSLHSNSIIQALRLLIALAGPAALSGAQLEICVRSIAPLLNDPYCAEDVCGIIQYLLAGGRAYLDERPDFAWGTITLLLLRIKSQTSKKQDSTTQETQHRNMLSKLRQLSDWLVALLQKLRAGLDEPLQEFSLQHISALSAIRLPGNAVRGTPESRMLLYLLANVPACQTLVSAQDRLAMIDMLSDSFNLPHSALDDCLIDDQDASQLAPQLWSLLRRAGGDSNFKTWLATSLGRAYLASGQVVDPEHGVVSPVEDEGIKSSLARISATIHDLCSSTDPRLISLGVYTYRCCMDHCTEPEHVRELEREFSSSWTEAYNDGTHTYEPLGTMPPPTAQHDISEVLMASGEDWDRQVAQAVCRLPLKLKLLQGLRAMLLTRPSACHDLLPALVHIALSDTEHVTKQTFSHALVHAMKKEFLDERVEQEQKQRSLLAILLYCLKQEYPGERTFLDRVRSIPCDLMAASACAARVGLPEAALRLAEFSQHAVAASSRRSSGRQAMKASLPDDLLLSIFAQVDEPDSYYGVDQAPTLNTYLERAEHEGNGYKALMMLSAKTDAAMIRSHHMDAKTGPRFAHSLAKANLNSLAYAFAQQQTTTTSTLIEQAQRLQQWDLPTTSSQNGSQELIFNASTALVAASDSRSALTTIRDAIHSHAFAALKFEKPNFEWLSSLSSLVEMSELLCTDRDSMVQRLDVHAKRESWMAVSAWSSFNNILEARCSTLSILAGNVALCAPGFSKHVLIAEAKAVAGLAGLATRHEMAESSMSAAWRLVDLAKTDGLRITPLAQERLASVMWRAKDTAMSTQVLKNTLVDLEQQEHDIPISKAVLLAQIGHQLAEARLQNSSSILQQYLKPAIDALDKDSDADAGRVFHIFATFCDAQLQNVSAQEDFERVDKLRQQKMAEVASLSASHRIESHSKRKEKIERDLHQTKLWLKYDNEEYERLRQSRDTFLTQCVKNYMRTLQITEGYDTCLLRLYALWLDYCELETIQAIVDKHMMDIPSWKWVVLLNQLTSRLSGEVSAFQKSLMTLVGKISRDHMYHSVHHLYALRKTLGTDETALARKRAGEKLCKEGINTRNNPAFERMLRADSLYRQLAEEQHKGKAGGRMPVNDSPNGLRIVKFVCAEKIPPATINLPLQPDGEYDNVPIVTSIASNMSVMGGNSAPKVLIMYASDGNAYKQLFKSGGDDLRQDTIMEQVFFEVSRMLRKHKTTRQRSIRVRTYRVIPLTSSAGILEFVQDSSPLNDILGPAHSLYYPACLRQSTARGQIKDVQGNNTDTRVKVFRKVCEQIPPVMRLYFMSQFQDPEEWFRSRITYSRSLAVTSMLGHMLGLGDRHCQNILLDTKTGEVVHIDLGVAFEAGRVLAIPELVPFRLTRDIVDGLGPSGVEGVYRRCCEFTLEALRQDKDDIMTLLNVLRYDPLYNWTVSANKAKRMQHQGETGQESKLPAGKKNSVDESGQAERALTVVEKKLSTTLSVAATVSELIQQAMDEKNLATIFNGWSAYW